MGNSYYFLQVLSFEWSTSIYLYASVCSWWWSRCNIGYCCKRRRVWKNHSERLILEIFRGEIRVFHGIDVAEYYSMGSSRSIDESKCWLNDAREMNWFVQTILSPLENAVHLLEKTNRELKILVESNENDRELNVTPLSGKVSKLTEWILFWRSIFRPQVFSMLQWWVVPVLSNKYSQTNFFRRKSTVVL